MGDEPLHGPSLRGGGGRHRVVRRITGKQPWGHLDGSWEYPPLEAAMQEVGFEEVEMYVLSRRNMVGQYITKQLIMDLCEDTLHRPGRWVTKMWWKQKVMELMGAHVEVAAAGRGVEEDMDTEAEKHIRRLSSI